MRHSRRGRGFCYYLFIIIIDSKDIESLNQLELIQLNESSNVRNFDSETQLKVRKKYWLLHGSDISESLVA